MTVEVDTFLEKAYDAIQQQDFESLRKLFIDNRPTVTTTTNNQKTLLSAAIESENVDLFIMVLQWQMIPDLHTKAEIQEISDAIVREDFLSILEGHTLWRLARKDAISYFTLLKKEIIQHFMNYLDLKKDSFLYPENITIDYTLTGKAFKLIFEKVLSSSLSSIPMIGSLANTLLLDCPKELYEGYMKRVKGRNAEDMYNKLAKEISMYAQEKIEYILETSIHELIRIFEYQLLFLGNTSDIIKLSHYISEIFFDIFQYDSHLFTTTGLIQGLIQRSMDGLSSALTQSSTRLFKLLNLKIKDMYLTTRLPKHHISCYQVFGRSILRKESGRAYQSYEYYLHSTNTDKEYMFGSRAMLFEWNTSSPPSEGSQQCTDAAIEKEYKKELRIQHNKGYWLLRTYIPFYRHVVESDLLLPGTNFATLFQEKYGYSHTIIPVFRKYFWKSLMSLKEYDFQQCDFLKMTFEHTSMEKINWKEVYGIGVHFMHCNLTQGLFQQGDFRWSYFQDCKVQDNTIFTGSSLSYCLFDQQCNLINNITFPHADTTIHMFSQQLGSTWSEELENLRHAQDRAQRRGLEKQKSTAIILTTNQSSLIYNVEHGYLPCFIGRTQELTRIKEFFVTSTAGSVIVAGMGGMGKTQTILQFIHKYKENYQNNVRWISSETIPILKHELRLLAKDLLFTNNENANDEEILNFIKNKWRTMETCLLIFDNVESYDEIQSYLNIFSVGCLNRQHIIITTRYAEIWEKHAKFSHDLVIRLNHWSIEESIQYVQYYLTNVTSEDAKILCQLFDNIPLGLSHSVAYIYNNELTIAKYITLFESMEGQMDSILDSSWENKGSKHSQNLCTTILLTFEQLPPLAQLFVQYLSLLYAEQIPMNLFDEEIVDSKRIISLLHGYEIIHKDDNDMMINIHRITQRVIRATIMKDTTKYYDQLIHVLTMITYELEMNEKNIENILKKTSKLESHAMALYDQYKEILAVSVDKTTIPRMLHTLIAQLLRYIGSLYRANAKYALAEDMYNHSNLIHQTYFEDYFHGEYALLKYNMSKLYFQQGKYKQSLQAGNAALDIQRVLYGDNHQQTAETIAQLGLGYYMTNKDEKAIEFHQTALSIQQNIFGMESYDVASTMNALARDYRITSKTQKALDLHSQALAIFTNILGESHPEVATTYRFLSELYEELSKYQEGLTLIEKALMILGSSYGEMHPEYARALAMKASIYVSLCKYSEALIYCEQALTIRKSIFGEVHGDIASSYYLMGDIYRLQNDYDKALELYQQVYDMRKIVYGENHSDVAGALSSIGGIYESRGEFTKAMNYYTEAYNIRLQVYGSRDDPEVTYSLLDIAGMHYNNGDYTKALNVYEDVYTIRFNCFGKYHPKVGSVLFTMGNCNLALRRVEKALEYYNQSLDIDKNTAGEFSTEVAYSLANIARAYHTNGLLDKAMDCFDQSTTILKSFYLNQENVGLADNYQGIAGVYESQGLYDKAIQYYENALIIMKKIFGEQNIALKNCLNGLSSVYSTNEQYDKALEMIDQVEIILHKTHGETHPDIDLCYVSRSNIYIQMEKFDEALEYANKALDNRRKARGETHQEVAGAMNTVADVLIKQEEYDEAIAMILDALYILIEIYGKTHEIVANCYKRLASAYADKNEYTSAISYYQSTLDILNEVYGESHADIANVYMRMGNIYSYQGDQTKALEMQQKCLFIQRRVLGETHPFVGNTLGLIGIIYFETNQLDKAFIAFEESISILRMAHTDDYTSIQQLREFMDQLLKENAPNTIFTPENIRNPVFLRSLHTVVGYRESEQDYWNAKSICKRLRNLEEAMYGPNDPKTVETKIVLGKLYMKIGKNKIQKSINLLKSAYEIQMKMYDDESHPSIIHTLELIGKAYVIKEDLANALHYYQSALQAIHQGNIDQHDPRKLELQGFINQLQDSLANGDTKKCIIS